MLLRRAGLLAVLVVALASAGGAWGCAGPDAIDYDPGRGLFRADLPETAVAADVFLKRADDLRERRQYEAAYARYEEAIVRWPATTSALWATRGRVLCLIGLNRLVEAHNTMSELVRQFKEYLLLTENVRLWAEFRALWYREIAMRLFYSTDGYQRWLTAVSEGGLTPGPEAFAEDQTDAITVLDDLYREEPSGVYAVRCLLRIGDARFADGKYQRARTRYLLVVSSQQGSAAEREEALFKAAYATLATMKGAEYDQDVLRAPGSELTERGALDLCRDYRREFPGGRYTPQIAALEGQIQAIFAYRIYRAGEVYERQGFTRAALMEYWRLLWTYANTSAAVAAATPADAAATPADAALDNNERAASVADWVTRARARFAVLKLQHPDVIARLKRTTLPPPAPAPGAPTAGAPTSGAPSTSAPPSPSPAPPSPALPSPAPQSAPSPGP